MKTVAFNFVALALVCVTNFQPASAKEFGRTEKPGDMNIFQVEPSVLNERFYTSGNAERKQYCGKVLPAGAAIPDNDAPLSEQKAAPKGTKEVTETPSPVKSKEAALTPTQAKPASEKSTAPSAPVVESGANGSASKVPASK